jgi:hypothetical protein
MSLGDAVSATTPPNVWELTGKMAERRRKMTQTDRVPKDDCKNISTYCTLNPSYL